MLNDLISCIAPSGSPIGSRTSPGDWSGVALVTPSSIDLWGPAVAALVCLLREFERVGRCMDSVELDDAIWAITKASELREKADWDTKVLVDEMLYQLGEGCAHCSFAIVHERAIMIDVLESYLRRKE